MGKPLFQKRHYEVIASCIREANIGIDGFTEVGNQTAVRLIKVFRADNPKFNEAKFWKAIENGNNK